MSLGLHRAASTGNLPLVLYALENGQSPNLALHGITPLHVAACMGNVATANLLMSFGADVNQPKGRSKVAGPGVEGSTPLHFAAANGHGELVRTLLVHGARPQPVDRSGHTPEMLAAASHSGSCVALLRHWLDTYGPEGHVDPAALQDTYAWGDKVMLVPSRESTPVTGALSPVLPPQGLREADTPPHPPGTTETRPRSAIPALLERASHPASSLRAALFSAGTAGRSDEVAPRSSRLPTRASITGLFRRGWQLVDPEEEARSGRSSRPESVLSTRPRSSSKSSMSTATTSTPPPSTPGQAAPLPPPPPVSAASPMRPLLSSPSARLWSPSHTGISPDTAHVVPVPLGVRRLRSHSATQYPSGAEFEGMTRARAHSEMTTMPSLDDLVSSAWSLPPTPTHRSTSLSPPPDSCPPDTSANSPQDLLQTLQPVAQLSEDDTPEANHSQLALYLAQVGSLPPTTPSPTS
ncbi:hypothetical protein MNAN1_000595 [Malassezia nana]|uniref:Uncharacterized protein n=1 Tax=Malassezia nana TaxID=180528 RepID=A0AAF0EFT4_9BASI|nr:hypothetical protein MNAN1_000595 [Malassezia nana]